MISFFLYLVGQNFILIWAAEMVRSPSPRLVSALLMAATTGTAIGPAPSTSLVTATFIQMPNQVGLSARMKL